MFTILVIDEDIYQLKFLSSLLQTEGYHVVSMIDPIKIKEFLINSTPHLIIGNVFIDDLCWSKENDHIRLLINPKEYLSVTCPVVYYCPSFIANQNPSFYKNANTLDGLIDSNANKNEILATVTLFLTDFKKMTPIYKMQKVINALNTELCNVKTTLRRALEVGQMNVWDWNIDTTKVNDFGYFNSIAHPHGYLAPNSPIEWFIELVHPEDQQMVLTKLANTMQNEAIFDTEYRIKLLGEMEWIFSRGKIFYDEMPSIPTKKRVRCVGVWKEVTKEKNNEVLITQQKNALKRMDRINSFGEISSTLSHQLTQPLNIIKSYVGGCIHRIKDGLVEKDELLEVLNTISNCVDQAGNMVKNMKDFIRKGESIFTECDIKKIIEKAHEMIKHEYMLIQCNVIFNFEKSLPPVVIDELQIKQVIINIIQNSIDAMKEAKTKLPTITVTTALKNPHSVMIRISDNGPGVPAHIIDSLFIPCFSTKVDGMGVGLKVCRNIIEAHGGKIELCSSSSEGASFYFTLPAEAA